MKQHRHFSTTAITDHPMAQLLQEHPQRLAFSYTFWSLNWNKISLNSNKSCTWIKLPLVTCLWGSMLPRPWGFPLSCRKACCTLQSSPHGCYYSVSRVYWCLSVSAGGCFILLSLTLFHPGAIQVQQRDTGSLAICGLILDVIRGIAALFR